MCEVVEKIKNQEKEELIRNLIESNAGIQNIRKLKLSIILLLFGIAQTLYFFFLG